MKNYVIKVIREKGKVIEVLTRPEGKEIAFIKERGKVVRKDKDKSYHPFVSDKIYAEMYKQVQSVFAGSKKKKTKQIKKAKKIYTHREDKIKHEAKQLNEKIIDYRNQHPAKSWTEASFEVIKSFKNAPIRPQFLTKAKRQWLDNLKSCGVQILTEGWLEISRWDKQINKKPRLIKQKVTDHNFAIRMQNHILDEYKLNQKKYQGELSKLATMEEIIQKANDLLTDWPKVQPEKKNEMQKELACVILRLEKCRNEFKIEARSQIKKASMLKDKLNRINPSAMAARTIAALNRLNARLNELEIIIPHTAMRKEILILEKRRLDTAISKAAKKTLEIFRHQVFHGKAISQHEPKILETNINKALYFLNDIWMSPYWEQGEQAKLFLGQAKKFISMNRFAKVKTALKETLNILGSDLSKIN